MQASLVGCCIRHRVQFAPDPQRKSFPTEPKFVERRRVRDITKFPKGVNYVSFHDVGEMRVYLSGGRNAETQLHYTEPFNDSQVMLVAHDEVAAKRLANNGWHEIDVHDSLVGKVWVYGSLDQVTLQKAA